MRVIRAEVMGMCFGVRDALEVVEAIDEPATVTIHGQLVHNEVVQGRLAARGFAMRDETQRGTSPPETPAVLITAHGISDRERRAAGVRRQAAHRHDVSAGPAGPSGGAGAPGRGLSRPGDRPAGARRGRGDRRGPGRLRRDRVGRRCRTAIRIAGWGSSARRR